MRAKNSVDTRQPAAITPLTITQSVIDFAPLIALGLGWASSWRSGFYAWRAPSRRATRHWLCCWYGCSAPAKNRSPLTGQDRIAPPMPESLAMLNQAGLDAAGRSLNIERVLSVTAGDHPAVIALGHRRPRRLCRLHPTERQIHSSVFGEPGRESSASEVAFEHATAYPLDRLGEALTSGAVPAYPLDALNSGLFVTDDLAAVYAYLAAELTRECAHFAPHVALDVVRRTVAPSSIWPCVRVGDIASAEGYVPKHDPGCLPRRSTREALYGSQAV